MSIYPWPQILHDYTNKKNEEISGNNILIVPWWMAGGSKREGGIQAEKITKTKNEKNT